MATKGTGREGQEKSRAYIPEDVLEHAKSARREFRKSLESFFPPGFLEHTHAARREALLAFRSLIDHALERMEQERS